MLPKTRLASLGVRFPFFVGPMVGLTHVALRELIRSYVPASLEPLLFTEMLSTRRLPSERLDSAEALRCAPGERGIIPQLLGNEERFLAPSIAKLLPLRPWGFDINMGCPASLVLKHNWGVRLMGDRDYAAQVVAIAKRHSPVPISVKLRAGLNREVDLNYLDQFTRALEDAGADWLTLHCRTQGQEHRGRANWDVVRDLAGRRSIPVVANGDVQTAEEAIGLVQSYGVDGVMIGRAATARPWILWQIAHRLGIDEAPRGREGGPPTCAEEESREYFRACLSFLDLLERYYCDTEFALKKFHFFILTGSAWFFYGHTFWRSMMVAKSLSEARGCVLRYQERYAHPYVKRADLN